MLGSRPGTGLLTVPFNKFSCRDLGVHSPLLLGRLPELASRKQGTAWGWCSVSELHEREAGRVCAGGTRPGLGRLMPRSW